MKVELIVYSDSSPPKRVILMDLPATIGRNPDAQVCLRDPWVSRQHCLIAEQGGKLMVRDLDSKHGTFVNRTRVKEVRLLPGDRIGLGTQSIVVKYGLTTPTLAGFQPDQTVCEVVNRR